MTYFVTHEPCPRCGSRNNLGVWSDGHKWCFGCHYFVAGSDTIHSIRERVESDSSGSAPNDPSIVDSSCWIYNLPKEPLNWLSKYGISQGEIIHFGLAWNTKTSSLVLPIVRDKGQVILAQERYFGPDPSCPKYITYGQRNNTFLFVLHSKHPKTVVFTEDFLSAIKVGRLVGAVPVLGCTIPDKALKWAVGHMDKARVWYDMDKAVESVTQASRLSQYVPSAKSIITELDPKEYTTQELHNILTRYDTI